MARPGPGLHGLER